MNADAAIVQVDVAGVVAKKRRRPSRMAPRPYGKSRFVTVKHLDRRTIAAKRAAALAKEFETELGGGLSVTQRAAVERAATLAACAEDARVRRLAGDPSVNLDDLVRVDRLADLAIRRLGIGNRKSADAAAAVESFADIAARAQAEASRKRAAELAADAEGIPGSPARSPMGSNQSDEAGIPDAPFNSSGAFPEDGTA
jgi:hypothetical protein